MRKLHRTIAVLLIVGSAAACVPAWLPFGASTATPTPTPTATPSPTPTATPTPLSTLDAFEAWVASGDFQAEGSVSGTVQAKLILGSASGTVAGTFKVKGGDSDVSVTFKILGATMAYDSVVVDGSSYSRSNGGGWSKSEASGKTLQAFLSSGVVLTDEGVETWSGRQLHHLSVADPAGIDPSAFGITSGAGQENLAIDALSFWVESDGTPAGLSVDASLDQKILGTQSHETVKLDIVIDSTTGVEIAAPTV
jgi:hypothetical protein